MVDSLSIFFMLISALLIFLFPLGLAVYMYKKARISLKPIFVGALLFIVFQFLTRIPLINFFSTQPWFQNLMGSPFFSILLVGGLTAGLFEESGRYLGFRFFLKKELAWENGIAYGIGHGGIEAISLAGISNINNIVISMMINTGTFDSVIAPQIGAETAAMLKTQLISTAPVIFLAGGLERLFAMLIQIALSLVVLYAVMNRKFTYLVYAVLLHAMVNASSVLLLRQGFSIWLVEFWLFMLAVAAVAFIQRSQRLFARTSIHAVGSEEGE